MEVIDISGPDKTDGPSVETYLDCAGRKRIFRLELFAERSFLEAVELRNGEPVGLRFILPVEDGAIPPWGQMRDRIRERLSQRDLVRDADGGLHCLNRLIRGQISDRDHEETGTPVLLIDDMEITWDELGQLLMVYSGWGLRLEIRNCGEE